MGRELGQGKGPGDCISLLVFPTAGLQHPGRKSLAAGNLHLQGVSILVPFPPRPCLCPWELLSRPGVQGGSGCLTSPRAWGWDLSQSHQNILHHFLVSSQPLELLPGAVWEGSCGRSAAAIPALPSQVIPDSDAHRAGLQEGDQVLSVNDVDFQDIEHSKVSAGMGNPPPSSLSAQHRTHGILFPCFPGRGDPEDGAGDHDARPVLPLQ